MANVSCGPASVPAIATSISTIFPIWKSVPFLSDKDAYWINVSDDLRFLKDGKRFLWSSERSGYRHLYLYDFSGKQPLQLTKGDWEVSHVDGVDEAKDVVYFTA